jgi:hypothetical protein
MIMKFRRSVSALALATSLTVLPAAIAAEETKPAEPSKAADSKGLIDCKMEFNLSGWSAIYSTSKGEGTITCNNGATAKVKLKSHGGGITFGKSDVIGGTGHFTGAKNIEELYGSYAQSEANAGAGKSAAAQAMTKGEVSLSLAGTGRGVNVGFSFGKFDILKPGDKEEDKEEEKNK